MGNLGIRLLFLNHGPTAAGQGAAAFTHACLCHSYLKTASGLSATVHVALLVTLQVFSLLVILDQHYLLNLVELADARRRSAETRMDPRQIHFGDVNSVLTYPQRIRLACLASTVQAPISDDRLEDAPLNLYPRRAVRGISEMVFPFSAFPSSST
jgi:hypothetical protein